LDRAPAGNNRSRKNKCICGCASAPRFRLQLQRFRLKHHGIIRRADANCTREPARSPPQKRGPSKNNFSLTARAFFSKLGHETAAVNFDYAQR
jgi:hypothetical protein